MTYYNRNPRACAAAVVLQMEEETARFVSEKDERTQQLLERQAAELQQFDLETSTMGLDALQIRDESEQTYLDEDIDTMSTRGSMLSLTPSASTNSFIGGGGAYGGGGGRMTPPMSGGHRVSVVSVGGGGGASASKTSRQGSNSSSSRSSYQNSNNTQL